jgi:Ca2+-binding RTX toxin-like protein
VVSGLAGGVTSIIGFENVHGGSGNDFLVGNADDNILTGSDGNDVLNGDAGDDQLYGNDDNDTLIGGLGNDTLQGGSGNDRYQGFIGNFGDDLIIDDSGTADVLSLTNFNLSDATFSAVDTDSDTYIDQLVLDFGGGNVIRISNYFDNTSDDEDACDVGSGYIETIAFADDSSVDLAQVQSIIA